MTCRMSTGEGRCAELSGLNWGSSGNMFPAQVSDPSTGHPDQHHLSEDFPQGTCLGP